MYRSLYKDCCQNVFKSIACDDDTEQSSWYCQKVEERIGSLASSLDTKKPYEMQSQNLQVYRAWWSEIKTHNTCLICLQRKPEYVLTCGHSMCEICVRTFGLSVPASEVVVEIDSCVLCASGSVTAYLKPKTAGISVLSIDGGGTRGIVPLEFLKMVQGRLGQTCAVQELFDFVAGTSSGKKEILINHCSLLTLRVGGLIAMALFLQGWTVVRSIEQFRSMTKKVFRKPYTDTSLLNRCRQYMKSFMSDGYYSIDALEECLQESYGQNQRMFDTPRNRFHAKVAVTASNIAEASTFIFSNYNGVGEREMKCGYKHLRPENIDDEPFMWQA